MMLKDLLLKNRSYRGFDEHVKISRETLLELIDCARICPSAVNAQPLKYYLINEPEELAKMQPLTIWAHNLPELKLPREGHRPTAFILICGDASICGPSAVSFDVGIAAQSILLAATEKGLGGCIIRNFDYKGVSAAFRLPETMVPIMVIGMGKPDETVILTEAEGSTAYYRDENDIHYVPKRKLSDIILPRYSDES